MNALEVRGLNKRFGHVQALRGISLTVPQGKCFGFLGPNGAGKSTTIRSIMDFIRPDSGSISILGKDARADSTALKKLIGYVPAEPNLYANWTVDEHIQFVARVRGIDAAPAGRLKDDLELSGKPKIRHLSTGNQQKVAIVLGLMTAPKLLILDEPTRGLDPLLQAKFHALLREYHKDGGTVFLSSHNLAEVDELCTDVAVIKEGQIITASTLSNLKQKSLHNVRATFTGKVPDLAKLGATNLQLIGPTAHFQIRGDINRILQELARRPVRDLEITRASLEDMFMELYQ